MYNHLSIFLIGPMQLSVMLHPKLTTTVERKLSYWINSLELSGRLTELYKYEVLRGVPLVFSKPTAPFDIFSFGGVMFLYIVFITPILLWKFCDIVAKMFKRSQKIRLGASQRRKLAAGQ